jgi:hypothetical protein
VQAVRKRLERLRKHYKTLSPGISDKAFLEAMANIEEAVLKITERGGRVVFIRLPVSGDHIRLDEEFYPRAKYWDIFASTTIAETINLMDYEWIHDLCCPDTSHIDFRDSPYFTKKLFDELQKRNIIN